jgi:GNAT superfamily N-acetyltransferase
MRMIQPDNAAEWEQVRELFREYWASFGFSPCFQDFGAEVAGLPGAYAPPGGALVLALIDGQAAGCAALRRFDASRAEAKRLYVRPQFRGQGVGRALLDWVIAEARGMGYRELVGDTIPQMAVALAMYDRAGFERTGPYAETPTPGAIYLRLMVNIV